MLKLKKVQILGFKSFCDRTEVQLAGEGIAAIVGPNGCGKSNISDAITWVLGEQSAKSLRGIKMEDVIFAGTRDRKPTGMAEVSLTLVDPEVYDGASPPRRRRRRRHRSTTPLNISDWDETTLRQQRAAETEEAVAEAQPGTVIEGRSRRRRAVASRRRRERKPTPHANRNNVVLKIRRRKFGRAPVRAGEITITRRLFRSGDSEYLLNGKICRLRDIQDIFMGTGLGGETYAIIGQERIGQLLSSKPLDRRAIIEEAAGITRFKTKKRLAELRLESAKQNLSRVNDIFEEVTRQMGMLKRQAAKAERYGALRDELRAKLRVVLASRLTQMDAEQPPAAAEDRTPRRRHRRPGRRARNHGRRAHRRRRRGYALDQQIREAGARANQSAVELERIAARTASNADRIAELTNRIASGTTTSNRPARSCADLAGEQEQHRSFLETATAESASSREAAQAQQAEAQNAVRAVAAAEQQVEQTSPQLHAAPAARRARPATKRPRPTPALAGLEREAERLQAESEAARQRARIPRHPARPGQALLRDVTERLKRLEAEIAEPAQRTRSQPQRRDPVQAPRRPAPRRAGHPHRPPQLARAAHPRAQLLHRHR